MSHELIVTIASFVFLVSILLAVIKPEIDQLLGRNDEEFSHPYLYNKSKCFQCEREMINRCGADAAWMANPSKTYTAEVDGIIQNNGDIAGGFMGKTVRFFTT